MEGEQLYFSKRKPAKCPACASPRLARIVYGYPGPDLIEDVESGKISLGGCCVSDFDPAWQCLECAAAVYPETLKGQMPPELRAFVDEQRRRRPSRGTEADCWSMEHKHSQRPCVRAPRAPAAPKKG